MTTQTNPGLQQLIETVAQLREAVAASERRHANTTRAIRWTALSLIVLMSGVIYATSDWMKAYADQVKNPWAMVEAQISNEQPPLMGIMASLLNTKELQGAMVKVMQSVAAIASNETTTYLECERARSQMSAKDQKDRLCFSLAAVEDLGEYYLDENGKLPSPPAPNDPLEKQMAYAKKMMESTLMAAGQTIIDGAVLVHRLRRDSDRLRNTVNQVGGVDEALGGIVQELHVMNAAMRSIPAMANEMNVMNQQMSVMSYSVGSTMGRMGNMMPW